MGKWMDGFIEKLEAVRQENLESGGTEKIDMQHKMGKLTIRERIDKLLDLGSFNELGSVVREVYPPIMGVGAITPGSACDGIVMGFGRIDGREVAVCGTDFTVMSGTIGDQGSWKMADIVAMARERKIPLISIFDSAGARYTLKNGNVGFDGFSKVLNNYCLGSGVIPQIGVILGPCIGLLGYAALMCDFLIMNENTSFLWLGGKKVSADAGNAYESMVSANQCDIIARSDEEALECVKKLLSFMPQNCWEKPPKIPTEDPPDRIEQDLLDIMPDDPKFTYDIHDIIEKIVDDGEFYELKENFAPNIVIGFARFGGMPVGIVANNPDELSGVLEPDSSDKYDRFMSFLDAFNIPLITLSDTTAFAPGDKWERIGVLRHGAKLLHTYSRLTTAKITIQLRRSYGGGNLVMGSYGMGPDLVYAWPSTEFAPTGPDTLVQTMFKRQLEGLDPESYKEMYNMLVNTVHEMFNVMNWAHFWTIIYTVHEVIDPRETRLKIIEGLLSLTNKRETVLPENKRAIKPA